MTTAAFRTRYGQRRTYTASISVSDWLTNLPRMAEEAAAVIICCAPTTATFFKQAKAPVRSWLSRVRGRALRLTGLHRSDMPHSGSHSKLKDSLESGWNAADSRLQAREDNTVRVDTEFNAYSMRQMSQMRTPASSGI